jgi:pimeloyl-ACP methyl ester carboxylesterase
MSFAEVPPPSGRLIQVNGQQVHVHVEGSGPDIVLIHGAGGNLRDYTFDLMGRLSGSFRVTAFDRPGLGHSAALPGGAASPAEQAALLDAAAAQLGIGRAVVVGHSYGAAVAMAWALDRPQRVAAVVSMAGVVQPWEGDVDAWYRVAGSRLGGALVVPVASALVSERQARRILEGIFAPNPVPQGYFDHIGMGFSTRPETIRENARQVRTLKPHVAAMAPRYAGLTLPIEIIHGSADETVGLDIHSRPLAAQVPGARLTVLDGVGHMPHHARPEEAAAAIRRAAARAGLR